MSFSLKTTVASFVDFAPTLENLCPVQKGTHHVQSRDPRPRRRTLAIFFPSLLPCCVLHHIDNDASRCDLGGGNASRHRIATLRFETDLVLETILTKKIMVVWYTAWPVLSWPILHAPNQAQDSHTLVGSARGCSNRVDSGKSNFYEFSFFEIDHACCEEQILYTFAQSRIGLSCIERWQILYATVSHNFLIYQNWHSSSTVQHWVFQ